MVKNMMSLEEVNCKDFFWVDGMKISLLKEKSLLLNGEVDFQNFLFISLQMYV